MLTALIVLIVALAGALMVQQINELKGENAELKQQVTQLQEELMLVQQKYDDKAMECEKQAASIVQLKADQAALKDALALQQKELEDSRQIIEAANLQLDALMQENETVHHKLQKAVEFNEQSAIEIAKKDELISSLEADLAALEEKNAALGQALDQAEEAARHEKEKKNELSLRIMQAEAEVQALKQEIEALKARILILKNAR